MFAFNSLCTDEVKENSIYARRYIPEYRERAAAKAAAMKAEGGDHH
jgi:hypothetical protein